MARTRGRVRLELVAPPAPRGPARAGSYVSVAFLLRRLRRAALVGETHGRPIRWARYRDGDEGRRERLLCNVSGRRTTLADADCKHGATALDSRNLDAVAARRLTPLIRDDHGE